MRAGIRARLLSNSLFQNTLWALSGYGLRLVIQAAYFVLIARCLGPGQYGGFVAATAVTGLLAPFAGLGSGNLLIKNVARQQNLFAEYWGKGLLITLISGVALVGAVIAAAAALLPKSIPMFAIVCIAVSDLILVKLVELAGFAFQAFEMLSRNAHLNVLISLTRLVGIAGLAVTLAHPNMRAWSLVYLVGSAVTAVIGVIWCTASLGRPVFSFARTRAEYAEGFTFSAGLSAQTIYNDIDKTMLARLGTLEATGIYSAAYRLIDVAFIPVRSLLNAAYPRLFRSGSDGLHGALSYSRRLLIQILPYSIFSFAALWLGAPIVPLVLGHGYANTTEALRWLALLPLLKTFHYFAADAMTGAGHQGTRTVVQIAVALFNVLFNLWIIPAYGWRGAAWSSLASDGLLAVSLWIIASLLAAKSRLSSPRAIIEVGETIES